MGGERPESHGIGGSAPARQRILITRDFGLIWWGQMISQVGDGVSKLALIWFVYSVTGSPLKTTVIGFLQTIPPILFGPFIGVWLDRLPKKPILIGTDVMRAVLIGVIPCAVAPEAFTVDWLYVLVFLHAVATAVFGPALLASVPDIVPRSRFTAANALLQTTTSLGIVLGPTLSGIGIAALSSQEVLCINAVTYLVSAACFVPVRFAPTKPADGDGPVASSMARDLVEGLRFTLIERPMIVLLIGTAALYTFGASAFTTLFPVFGRKILDLGPVEVGYLWSALGVGLFLVSIRLVRMTEWALPDRLRAIARASALSGAALCGLVWVKDRLVAGLLMGVIGAGLGVLTPIAWAVLQEITPMRMLARILTVYTTGTMLAAITGIMVFGWVTEEFGERAGVVGIALLMGSTAIASWGFGHWVIAQPEHSTRPSGQADLRSAEPLSPSRSGSEETGWRLLKTRDFGMLFAGQVVSQIGDGLIKVALLWFVYTLTGSALKMTVIGLLQTLPPLVLGPLIGVYLDRLPKKRVMIWVDLVRAVIVFLIPLFYTLNMLTLERLYLLVFAMAIVSTIFGPALSSTVPLIAPRNQLTSANALIQGTMTIGVTLGPALSGYGIALFGEPHVLFLGALMYLASALCLIPIRARATFPATDRGGAPGAFVRDLATGFRFVFLQHRSIQTLLLTATLHSLVASSFVLLLPVIARQVLKVGPAELGWLWAANGAGMFAATAWLAWAGQGTPRERLRLVAGAMAVAGAAVCGLSLFETPFIVAVLALVIGGGLALFIPIVWGLLQEWAPEHMLGRVFTMFSTGAMFTAMVGMLGFGWAADALGARTSLAVIGLILLVTAVVAAGFSRSIGQEGVC